MWSGDIASDLAASAVRVRAENMVLDAQEIAENNAHAARRNGELFEEMAEGNAANLAHRYALQEQLKAVDASNPLLTDTLLVERLQAAGTAAYRIAGNNFDAARELGRTFNVPGREKNAAPSAHSELANYKMAYAGGLAQRHALMAELKRFDPTNPLLTDELLIERIRNNGAAAYIKAGEDMAAAREVGETIVVPRTKNESL